MKHLLFLVLLLFGSFGMASAGSVHASESAQIEILNKSAEIDFPNSITFKAKITSNADIDRVVLEYGVDMLSCGTVSSEAYPTFSAGTSTNFSWKWDMRKSGSLPPGSKFWYIWHVTDKDGGEAVSDKQSITWIDSKHDWQTVSSGKLRLHWYEGDEDFATDLVTSADQSLAGLKETTGVALDSPVDLYIYANTDDMRDAILYEPGWTGGLAFPEHNIVILGISPETIDWGRGSEAHELTHVLVGHLTFSCLGRVPTWLNEGIAVYGEGGPDGESQIYFHDALVDDKLLSVRSLSGAFAESSGTADLSYSESYSLVNYLIETFGKEKIQTLFKALSESAEIDEAMKSIYGFGLDGLEDNWRKSIGAKSHNLSVPNPTARPTPTAVPTYPLPGMPTSLPAATAGPEKIADQTTVEHSKLELPTLTWATLALFPILTACSAGFIYRRRKSK